MTNFISIFDNKTKELIVEDMKLLGMDTSYLCRTDLIRKIADKLRINSAGEFKFGNEKSVIYVSHPHEVILYVLLFSALYHHNEIVRRGRSKYTASLDLFTLYCASEISGITFKKSSTYQGDNRPLDDLVSDFKNLKNSIQRPNDQLSTLRSDTSWSIYKEDDYDSYFNEQDCEAATHVGSFIDKFKPQVLEPISKNGGPKKINYREKRNAHMIQKDVVMRKIPSIRREASNDFVARYAF